MGAKIGNVVYSSGISGRDAATGLAHVWQRLEDPGAKPRPADPDRQAEVLFENLRKFMELAGGSPDDIVRMTVYLKEEEYRAQNSINKAWLKMFPDEHDRPAGAKDAISEHRDTPSAATCCSR